MERGGIKKKKGKIQVPWPLAPSLFRAGGMRYAASIIWSGPSTPVKTWTRCVRVKEKKGQAPKWKGSRKCQVKADKYVGGCTKRWSTKRWSTKRWKQRRISVSEGINSTTIFHVLVCRWSTKRWNTKRWKQLWISMSEGINSTTIFHVLVCRWMY